MRRTGLHARTFLVAVIAVGTGVAGCAPSADRPTVTYPPESSPPNGAVSAAVGQTRAAIVAALGEHRLTLRDAETPYRPVEAPLLASAPRAVYQAILPDDPQRGMIVVYEFLDSARAAEAAAEQQRYLASGPALIQSPEGTVHVIRGVGTTVVLYEWLPAAARDEAAPDIQLALETLGVGYPVSR